MSRLKEILQRKEERKVKLKASLDSIISQLIELGVLKIILFGSLASGDIDTYSDLDLLVIMPSIRTSKEWINLIYKNLERKVALDLIVYSQEEFKKELPQSCFLQNILKEGKVIYEKTT